FVNATTHGVHAAVLSVIDVASPILLSCRNASTSLSRPSGLGRNVVIFQSPANSLDVLGELERNICQLMTVSANPDRTHRCSKLAKRSFKCRALGSSVLSAAELF